MTFEEISNLALMLSPAERRTLAERLAQSLTPSALQAVAPPDQFSGSNPAQARLDDEGASMLQWLVDR